MSFNKSAINVNLFSKYATRLHLFLLGITPLLYPAICSDPAHTPIFAYLILIAFLPAISWFFGTQNVPAVAIYNPVFSLLSLIVVWGAISVVLITDNSESRLELARITSLWIFYCSVSIILIGNKETWLLYAIAVMGSAYMAFGYIDLYKFYNPDDLYFGLYDIRAHIGHKNLLAIFLSTTFPLVFYLMSKAKSKAVMIPGAIFLLSGTVLIFLIQSRVGIIGLISLFFFFTVYFLTKQKGRTVLIFAASAVLVVVLVLIVFRNANFVQFSVQRVVAITSGQAEKNANTQSIHERIELWKRTVMLIEEHPISGCGLGQWKIQIPSKDINNTRAKFGNVIFQQPHNDLLWYFSEYGIAGFLFYVGLIGFIVFTCIRSIRNKKRNNEDYLLDFILLSGVSVFFIQSLFDFPKERPVLLMLFAVYLAMFSFRYAKQEKAARNHLFVKLTFISLILILTYYFSNRTKNEFYTASMLQFRKQNNFQTVIAIAQNLQDDNFSFDHTGTPVAFYEGEAFHFIGNNPKSIECFTRALSLSPYHLYSWSNLGGAYFATQNIAQALACWDKAIEISKDFAEPHINKAVFAYQKNDFENAIEALRFDVTKEDSIKYEKEISTIYRNYYYNFSKTLSDTLLAAELKKMANDRQYAAYVYNQTLLYKNSFRNQALEEAIFVLEKMDKKISAAEASQLKEKYRLAPH